jgi:hypothetical protein
MDAATIAERQARGTRSLSVSLPASADILELPRQQYFRRLTGALEDAVLLMLVVLLVPLIVLLVGAPIALCVRAVIEIVQLFF